VIAIAQYVLYGLIFYAGYRLLRRQVYARGGELPVMHPAAFLERYYMADEATQPISTAERLRQWIDAQESAEDAGAANTARLGQKAPDYPQKVLVCLGDSITHGRCSDDWVQRVRDRMTGEDWEVVNAGINGDTAWNILQRLADVIACQPDAVCILCGTNDISALQTPQLTAAYRRSKGIPAEVPFDLSGYLNIMRRILEQLQQQTRAKIAVFTIPMFGEDAGDAVNETVARYNEALVGLCRELGIAVLDLNTSQRRLIHAMHEGELPAEETLRRIMQDCPVKFASLKSYDTRRVEREVEYAPWQRFVLIRSWNTISDHYGYYTLIDGIHLNDRGGQLASNLIVNWLKAD